MKKKIKWAIIGGGNGGQSIAGHLSLMGYAVRLFDIFEETVDAINAQGGIHVSGAVSGFGKVDFATTEMAEALSGADVVMIVAPATAHRAIAKNCAPCLNDGQVVIVHPGATCGAVEFHHILKQAACRADVAIAETNSLIYACRSPRPGHANIIGIKKHLTLATLPTVENPRVLSIMQDAFPQIVGGKNVMETSLGNANAIVHPAPSLLNTSMIESAHEWLYYTEGMTPSIGAFVEKLDRERVQLAASFGIEIVPIREWYRVAYGVDADTLTEAVRKNPAYEGIKGQKNLKTRYLMEDIPTGLVPMIALGKMQGIDMPRMAVVAELGQYLLNEDFLVTGRTLENLGLQHMTPAAFMDFIETGH
ncbi:NAD/NADP octopine/nopaline dehydrogenase [Olavius algarvensis associated proteobacterium Delta 3]|nr:NAD/NADP octopine/nopaline dehydrogenase [Olavius algarvensis associated proteobacterium Delta 3]